MEGNSLISISNGATFKGWQSFIGLGIIIFGLIVFIANIVHNGFNMDSIIILCLLFLGLILFLSIRGIQISSGKRVREYFDFLFFKVGYWKEISVFDSVEISYFKEDIYRIAGSHSNRMMDARSWTITSFDIYINAGIKRFLVKECNKYSEAIGIATKLSEELRCVLDNKISEKARR